MAAVTFTDATLTAAIRSGGVVLAAFAEDGSLPWDRLAPAIEALATELAGRAIVGTVQMPDLAGTAARFAVQSLPTLLVFKGGAPVETIIGWMPKAEIEKVLAKHL